MRVSSASSRRSPRPCWRGTSRPIAVTRFCEQPDLPHVGGTKDPDVDAIVALGPDLVVMCDEENRRSRRRRAAGRQRAHPRHDGRVRRRSRARAAPFGRHARGAAPSVDRAAAGRTRRERSAFIPIWRRPWMTMNRVTYGSSAAGVNSGSTTCSTTWCDRYPRSRSTRCRGRARRRPGAVRAVSVRRAPPAPSSRRSRRSSSSTARTCSGGACVRRMRRAERLLHRARTKHPLTAAPSNPPRDAPSRPARRRSHPSPPR